MEASGYEAIVSTFITVDLPDEAAGNHWRNDSVREKWEDRTRVMLESFIGRDLPILVDHCEWEQAALPFG